MQNIDAIMSYFRTTLGGGTTVSEARIREIVEGGPFDLTMESREQMIRELEASFNITQLKGAAVTGDKYFPWLEDRKPDIEFFFWNRLKRYYIETGELPPHVINTLDQVTDQVLDWCGDPQSPEPRWLKRGMVMGHVQSGKTTNYSALISKATDAGYEIIILLAGLTNSLRSQTQERIDETFIGKRSVFEDIAAIDLPIQVYGPEIRYAAYGTTRLQDFTITRAGSWGISLAQIKGPMIFVTKKNKSVLEGLASWLRQQNPGDLIDHPLLLIDDEADNGSINTRNDPTRATAINEAIRSILAMFSRSSYVGYTATPFANIFIDPDSEDEMIGNDLFPHNFIKVLDPPSNYAGATKIFDEDGELRETMVREVEDFGDLLPLTHKKDDPLDALPKSMETAIRVFVLTRAIRVLRGNGGKHASMMINVSRFNDVQEKVEGLVYSYLNEVKDAIKTNAGRGADGLKDEILRNLKNDYDREFAGCGFSWSKVQKSLGTGVQTILVRTVNMRNGDPLDYSANVDTGLHVIAVGGLALSRGLTLEGLTVSYILRNASASDTVMQMARWFGYRPNYEDLCRLYLPGTSLNHYEFVNEAIEELRTEIKRMEKYHLTPRDFGLRVRHSPAVIRITAANKMRTAETLTLAADYSGRHVEGYTFPNSGDVLTDNRVAADEFVENLGPATPSDKGWSWWAVSGRKIVAILAKINFGVHPDLSKIERDRSLLYDYISDRVATELSEWEVKLPTNLWRGGNSYQHPIEAFQNTDVPIMTRSAGVIEFANYKVTAKNKVASPGDERLGFTDEEKEEIIKECREQGGRITTEFCLRRTKPLLIIHMFKGSLGDDFDLKDGACNKLNRLASFSFILPPTGVMSKSRSYAVNAIYKRQLDMFANEDDDDEELLDAVERE